MLVMLIPIYGLIWPVPAAPYNLFPYLVVLAIAASAGAAWVIGKRRPEALARAGAVLAAGAVESDDDEYAGRRV
jgi:hypothetical protein